MPGFTEKEGENFPYEHSVMQFKVWDFATFHLPVPF